MTANWALPATAATRWNQMGYSTNHLGAQDPPAGRIGMSDELTGSNAAYEVEPRGR